MNIEEFVICSRRTLVLAMILSGREDVEVAAYEVLAMFDEIRFRVQGNRKGTSMLRNTDLAAIYEGTLRKALEILEARK